MGLDIRVLAGSDLAIVVWRPEETPAPVVPGCVGFRLYRKKSRPDGGGAAAGGSPPPATNPGLGSADDWAIGPIQDFMFADFDVAIGESVSYCVVPLVSAAHGAVKEDSSRASAWTAEARITADAGPSCRVYFNRGLVAAQWLTRRLEAGLTDAGQTQPKEVRLRIELDEILDQPETPLGQELREALGHDLRIELLRLLQHANGHVYAAIYLLDDPELLDTLVGLRDRLHIILANGHDATRSDSPDTADAAPVRDENARARARLKAVASPGPEVVDRMLVDGRLGHNKFVVVCDANGTAQKVWTGSGNWTRTGLCTQMNNALVIEQPAIAQIFLDQWQRLKSASQPKKARDRFPQKLLKENADPKEKELDGQKVTVWFSPVTPRCEPESAAATDAELPRDLQHVSRLIRAAQHGIFFLMYTPAEREGGGAICSLYDVIRQQAREVPQMHVQGVLNGWLGDDPNVRRIRELGGEDATLDLDPVVVVPKAVEYLFGDWHAEMERYSRAVIHSKVIVLDPLGERPVVVAGAHNLGPRASRCNDENLVIVEGNRRLAVAYAVHVAGLYRHYRLRYWLHLQGTYPVAAKAMRRRTERRLDDAWQQEFLTKDCPSARELAHWFRASP